MGKRIARLLAGAILLLGLVGCMGSTGSSSAESSSSAASGSIESEGASMGSSGQLLQPEPGAQLIGFKFHADGSYMAPYYTIKPADDGESFICAVTSDEASWPEIDGEDYWYFVSEEGRDPYAGFGASVASITAEDMAQLQASLEELGVLTWNGYDESYSPPEGVFDMDDRFELKLLYSDGSLLEARGYNRTPAEYGEVVNAIYAFFAAHKDRSASYPPQLPDAQVRSMTIELGASSGTSGHWRIEFNEGRGKWYITLLDRMGNVLPAGTDVVDSGDIVGEPPYDTFLGLIREYGLEPLNDSEESQPGGAESCYINIYFDNDQAFMIRTNVLPDNYQEFRDKCIQAMAEFYEQRG